METKDGNIEVDLPTGQDDSVGTTDIDPLYGLVLTDGDFILQTRITTTHPGLTPSEGGVVAFTIGAYSKKRVTFLTGPADLASLFRSYARAIDHLIKESDDFLTVEHVFTA